jgi:hypothetical protein
VKSFGAERSVPKDRLHFAGDPNLSEIAGAGDRLSLSGLHETGDERFGGGGSARNLKIGLNLVRSSCAVWRAGGQAREAPLEDAGRLLALPS